MDERATVVVPGVAGAFISLLFENDDSARRDTPRVPDYFGDLHLDRVEVDLVGESDRYRLAPLFRTTVDDATVARRQAVFRDLDSAPVRAACEALIDGLDGMREAWARVDEARHRHEKTRWFLTAAARYIDIVSRFTRDLAAADPQSDAFVGLRDYLDALTASDAFTALRDAADQRAADLESIRYLLLIRGLRVEVSRSGDELDYGAAIAKTFERFRQSDAGDHRQSFADKGWLNQVEGRVLREVAGLHPDIFAALDDFCDRYADYLDTAVARVERELRFCLAYQHYMAPIVRAGLSFCYPSLGGPDAEIEACATFDLALAHPCAVKGVKVVVNDLSLMPPERIVVVSGPNQGGKTTFARLFGQLHHLAALGCPVPGRHAQLRRWHGLFTQFERAEDIHDLRSKLEDDLLRIHDILGRIDRHSLVIMNEIFSSTTSRDAQFLGERVLRRIIEAGAVAVLVTFIDELAELDPAIVSMASTVDADDPAVRTFRILRKAPDGRAYARSLAERHGLTREMLEARL